jgi:hypothetical protein
VTVYAIVEGYCTRESHEYVYGYYASLELAHEEMAVLVANKQWNGKRIKELEVAE